MSNDNSGKNIKDKDIATGSIVSVNKTSPTEEISKTESVSEVSSVSKTDSIGKISSTSRIAGSRAATKLLSNEDRLKLLNLIDEEADRMEKEGSLPPTKKVLAKDAVKFALDAALPSEEELRFLKAAAKPIATGRKIPKR
jgi:hypothetical protein